MLPKLAPRCAWIAFPFVVTACGDDDGKAAIGDAGDAAVHDAALEAQTRNDAGASDGSVLDSRAPRRRDAAMLDTGEPVKDATVEDVSVDDGATHLDASDLAEDAAALRRPGTLDPSFGEEGTSRPQALLDFAVNDALVDSSGRIVLAGYRTADAAPSRAALARVLTDGAIDTSFGTEGVFVFDTDDSFVNAVTLDDDGNVIAAGTAGAAQPVSLLLLRLTEGGALDSTFGGTGAVTHDLGDSFYRPGDVRVAGNRVHVAGAFSTRELVLSRHIAASGALDSSFDMDGIVRVDPPFSIRSSGFVASGNVLAGVTRSGDEPMGLGRYDSDGVLDTTFGTAGLTTIPASDDLNNSFLLHAEDSAHFYAGGFERDSVDGGAVTFPIIMRTSKAGAVDSAFGTGGVWRFESNAQRVEVRSILPLAEGGALIGLVQFSVPQQGIVLRLNDAGEIDETFGPSDASDGLLIPSILPLALLPGPEGRAYVAGTFAGSQVLRIWL